MITAEDLREAIAECQGQRNPDASTCIKLAAFLTIQRELYGEKVEEPQDLPRYSYSAERAEPEVTYEGETEFAQAISGKNPDEMWSIMDELMQVIRVTTPRLYKSVMKQITD